MWKERRLTSPEAKRDLQQQSGLVYALSPPLQLGSTCSLLLLNLLLFFPFSSLIKPSVRFVSPPTWTSSTPCFHIIFHSSPDPEDLSFSSLKVPGGWRG